MTVVRVYETIVFHPGVRVDWLSGATISTFIQLEMKVWTSGLTSVTLVSDMVSYFDIIPCFDVVSLDVSIGGVNIRVFFRLDNNPVSIP